MKGWFVMRFKEKITDIFGAFGGVLYIIYMLILFVLPVAMITVAFDLPSWVNLIMIALLFFSSLFSYIFWIIGLIGVIIGPQDLIAIIYYVAFAIVCLPKIIITTLIMTSKSKD